MSEASAPAAHAECCACIALHCPSLGPSGAPRLPRDEGERPARVGADERLPEPAHELAVDLPGVLADRVDRVDHEGVARGDDPLGEHRHGQAGVVQARLAAGGEGALVPLGGPHARDGRPRLREEDGRSRAQESRRQPRRDATRPQRRMQMKRGEREGKAHRLPALHVVRGGPRRRDDPLGREGILEGEDEVRRRAEVVADLRRRREGRSDSETFAPPHRRTTVISEQAPAQTRAVNVLRGGEEDMRTTSRMGASSWRSPDDARLFDRRATCAARTHKDAPLRRRRRARAEPACRDGRRQEAAASPAPHLGGNTLVGWVGEHGLKRAEGQRGARREEHTIRKLCRLRSTRDRKSTVRTLSRPRARQGF